MDIVEIDQIKSEIDYLSEEMKRKDAEIERLMASVLAAKTLLQDADPDIESAWQVLDHAYHRRAALGKEGKG